MNLRYTNFVILDVETTGLSAKKDKVVEIGMHRLYDYNIINCWSSLVNPGMHIPPVVSAIHHIVDRDVEGKPDMEYFEKGVMVYPDNCIMVAHNAKFDKSFLPTLDKHRWICTIKCAKKLWPGLAKYTNQYLRYELDLVIYEKGDAHRVDFDITVTTALFRLILFVYEDRYVEANKGGDKEGTLEGFLEWYDEKIVLEKMPFGKHKGVLFRQVPTSYIKWALSNLEDMDDDVKHSMKKEMDRRFKGNIWV